MSVHGLKKIWVMKTLCDVDEEEGDHYHVNYLDDPCFIVRKEFLKVDKDGNGVYQDKKDFAGRMMAMDIFANFMKQRKSPSLKPLIDPILRRLNAIK